MSKRPQMHTWPKHFPTFRPYIIAYARDHRTRWIAIAVSTATATSTSISTFFTIYFGLCVYRFSLISQCGSHRQSATVTVGATPTKSQAQGAKKQHEMLKTQSYMATKVALRSVA